VLGADVVVPERPRLLLRENDDLAGAFRESLEHTLRLAGSSPSRPSSLSAHGAAPQREIVELITRALWTCVPGRGPRNLASSARTRRVSIRLARQLAVRKPSRPLA